MAHRKLSQSLLVSVNSAAALAAGVAVFSSPSEPAQAVEDEKRRRRRSLRFFDDGFFVRLPLPPLLNLNGPRKINSGTDEVSQRFGRDFLRKSSSSLIAPCQCEGVASLEESEHKRFERILAHHRSRISTYRQEWEYRSDSNATTSTKTPSRSWPDDVPSNEELSYLLEDVKYCGRSPNFRGDKDYCSTLKFRVASALLIQFNDENQQKGFDMLRSLAELGYPDAMVYYGMCLNEGRVAGMDPQSDVAVPWFRRCVDMYQHPHALYELGVAYYTGEGVAEDEEEAVRLFQLAGEQGHPAACYMLGDCLLDGIGVEVDRGSALEWLVKSGELGHRGARSRVMAVLQKKEGEDYGKFTDASRQTMIEHVTVLSADQEGRIVRRRTTLRMDNVVGGNRNPTELARRQTVVGKSRKES